MTATAVPALSVIIPALNEEEALPLLIGDLQAQTGIELEILVCDGGSIDETVARCQALKCQVLNTESGRAKQMNAGAEQAKADTLLFLHADSRMNDQKLLRDALQQFEQTCMADGHERVAGHFRLQFLGEDGQTRKAYRQLEAKTALNRSGTTNGDQGFLMRRAFFHAQGGFDDSLPFLEDQRLAEKIRACGHWITLPGVLQTSARRFEVQGFYRSYTLMSYIMCIQHIGLPGFFESVRGLYREQADTDLLAMSPFLRQIAQLITAQKHRSWLGTWMDAGRYVRGNAWQLFLLLDVNLGNQRQPALKFYDHHIARLINNRFSDAVTGVLLWFWVMVVLRSWFYFADPKSEKTTSV